MPSEVMIPVSTPVLTRADLISRAVNAGLACLTSAAAPAIMGEEKLVPSALEYPLRLNNSPFGS